MSVRKARLPLIHSIIEGRGIPEAEAVELAAAVRLRYPGVLVEVITGYWPGYKAVHVRGIGINEMPQRAHYFTTESVVAQLLGDR